MSRLLLLLSLLLTVLAQAAPPKASAAEEVNALALLSGARVVHDEEGSPLNLAPGLHDGTLEGQYDPRLTSNPPLIIELAEPFDLSRLELINSKDEEGYPGISVKKLSVEQGPSHKGPWQPLTDWELKKGMKPQSQAISAKKVRYLRVTLAANHGNPDWIGLSELRAWGQRSAQRQVQFTGAWQTNYGEMRLTQTGQRITGCYGTDPKSGGSLVEGTLEGTIFFGLWRELQEGSTATASEGTIAFALTQEGDLSGVWGSGPTDRTARWDGKKLAKATITCEKPEAGLKAELQEKGRVVLHGILFDTGKDTLRSESIPVLEALAGALKESPEVVYRIEGHTDDRGGQAPNQTLSEKRAASVKKWLVGKGIPDKQLQTKGFGMSRPALPNDSEAGRAANRRVEVVRAEE